MDYPLNWLLPGKIIKFVNNITGNNNKYIKQIININLRVFMLSESSDSHKKKLKKLSRIERAYYRVLNKIADFCAISFLIMLLFFIIIAITLFYIYTTEPTSILPYIISMISIFLFIASATITSNYFRRFFFLRDKIKALKYVRMEILKAKLMKDIYS